MMNSIKILSIAISLMVAVTFMPITGQIAFADEQEVSFSASGQVTGLKQSAAAYKSVTIKWNAYQLITVLRQLLSWLKKAPDYKYPAEKAVELGE